MIAAMEITEDTPMTMPSTVKAERTLDERSVSSAARKFSRVCASVIIAISQTSTPRSGPAVMRAMPDRSRKTIRLRNSEILRADAAPQGHVTFFRANEEIVFHFSAKVASRPQDQVCLILRLFKISGARFDVDCQACVRTFHAQEHRQGGHDEVVLVLPQDAADLLDDPSHHEFVVPDANSLPDRVHAEKQPLHQRVTDPTDVSAALGFRYREVAAKLYGARVNIRHAWRLPVEVHVRHFFIAVSHMHAAAC